MTGELEKFIADGQWIFANTMPKSLHHYIVLSEENEDNFVPFVKYIRENGFQVYYEKFTYPFTFLEYNGYRYWTIRNSLQETTIINKGETALYKKLK